MNVFKSNQELSCRYVGHGGAYFTYKAEVLHRTKKEITIKKKYFQAQHYRIRVDKIGEYFYPDYALFPFLILRA